MENKFNTWIVLLLIFPSVTAIAAEGQNAGTEEFSFLDFGSNDSCAHADCMQGTCVPNDNLLLRILFPYTCQCYSGWSTLAKVIPFLEIPSLPCNVPNCSLNLNCAGKSPAPAPGSSPPITSANTSSCLVPGICGHGTCEITSMEQSLVPTFKCICDAGYANVLNMTAGFCVNDCEISGSCRDLNLTVPGLGSPPSPASPAAQNQTANAGCRSQSFHGGYYLVAALVIAWSSFSKFNFS